MEKITIHPICNLLPELSEEEFQALCDDIDNNGQLEPIWLWKGQIIDGRHRYQACLTRNVEPKFRKWDGEEKDLPDFVLGINLRRRHLSVSQRAMIAAQLAEYNKKAAADRKAKTQFGNKPSTVATNLERPENQAENGRSAKLAAEQMGVGESTVAVASKVRKADPELAEEVAKGKVTLHAAEQQVKARDFGGLMPDNDDDGEARPAEEDREYIEDLEGNPIKNKRLREVFKERKRFGSLLAQLSKIMAEAEDIRKTPNGKWLHDDFQHFVAGIKNARNVLVQSQPHAVCPYCEGRADCNACKGTGWVVRRVWQGVPEDHKLKLKGGK